MWPISCSVSGVNIEVNIFRGAKIYNELPPKYEQTPTTLRLFAAMQNNYFIINFK